jgi:hypothetical protein
MEKKVQLNEEIISQIYFIRGRKVMLDSDLARIYGVETRNLNQAVKRNFNRFPADFMFQLSQEEFSSLISQIVISSSKTIDNIDNKDLMSQIVTSSWGGRRKLPFVFTEHGALMLASIKLDEHSEQLALVFQALRELVRQKEQPRVPVGFKIEKKSGN